MTAMLFRTADPVYQPTLAGWLEGSFTVVEDTASASESVYLDTFDWRLFNRSSALLLSGDTLTLASLDADGENIQTTIGRQPVFTWDLPDGRLKKQVEGVLEMRALLVRAHVRTVTTTYRVLNDDEKTVGRLAVDVVSLREGSDEVADTFKRMATVRG